MFSRHISCNSLIYVRLPTVSNPFSFLSDSDISYQDKDTTQAFTKVNINWLNRGTFVQCLYWLK